MRMLFNAEDANKRKDAEKPFAPGCRRLLFYASFRPHGRSAQRAVTRVEHKRSLGASKQSPCSSRGAALDSAAQLTERRPSPVGAAYWSASAGGRSATARSVLYGGYAH
jgi:hypothetical protein